MPLKRWDGLRRTAVSVVARELDGLAWDLVVADVWEAWVRSFARDLAPRIGLVSPGDRAPRRPLRWEGTLASVRLVSARRRSRW